MQAPVTPDHNPASALPTDSTTISPPLPRIRIWPALLTLYFLSPLIGEVLSNSTPIAMFVTNPFAFIYLPALYGSGAILVRELVRRRGLGWPSILLLGAAYGILEEALVVTSWFNPYWPDICNRAMTPPQGLCDYSRVLDTNVVWALSLTLYHATVSIAIPILLTERLFPHLAERPWLKRGGLAGFSIWLTLISLFGLTGFGFLMFRDQGYTHPPLAPYLVALFLAMGCIWLGLHCRTRSSGALVWPVHPTSTRRVRRVPRLWFLRLFGFVAVFVYFALPSALQSADAPAWVTVAVLAGVIALGVWRIRAWARRPGWTTRHQLALSSGVLGFFILVFAPILEVAGQINGKVTRGTSLFALAFLVLLIALAWRERRREHAGHDATITSAESTGA